MSNKNLFKERKNNHSGMTSRERVLAAFERKPVDYVPLCPFFNSLTPTQRKGYRYQFPFGESQQDRVEYCCNVLETDPLVSIYLQPCNPDPDVSVRKWFQNNEIHKKWITPSGELYAIARYDDKWPFGLDIPLHHDFTGHYVKHWLETSSDLKCLKHILLPLRTKEQLDSLKFSFMQHKKLADEFQLVTMSHIGTGLTGALQMFGATELCFKMMDEPELVEEYLELEHRVNMKHMEIMLELGTDVIRRNGFYETADFYSPEMLQHFLGKRLREEIKLTHEAGRLIGYTLHTGITPMLNYLNDLDFDCILHIDIAHSSNDIQRIKDGLGSRKSVMTGPSNTFHMWSHDTAEIKKAVDNVFDIFGKKGLILSSCPSSHSIMPWENTLAMIDEWKMRR